ncbi:MAG: hypothetical protein ACREU3_09310 [Steroidobacteraceae bacterium]
MQAIGPSIGSLRIQCPEQLKERNPGAFGRFLGLDRAPGSFDLARG